MFFIFSKVYSRNPNKFIRLLINIVKFLLIRRWITYFLIVNYICCILIWDIFNNVVNQYSTYCNYRLQIFHIIIFINIINKTL